MRKSELLNRVGESKVPLKKKASLENPRQNQRLEPTNYPIEIRKIIFEKTSMTLGSSR